MSIVAGTTRKNTCNNVIGGLAGSNTMDPPTPLEYGAPPNQSGASKAAKYAAWGGTGADATGL